MDTAGINHIEFLTSDLDRLCRFYEETIGARTVVELPIPEPEGPGRHALIAIGGSATLHPFEFEHVPPPPDRPMFQRGRIDHFALNISGAETFERLRTKLLDSGSSDGLVTNFGVMRVLSFTDPDGHTLELAHWVDTEDPTQIDASKATDAERTAQRAASIPPV
jgi:catechol 2,3-dioxygenase-like lactoylglutathione lyase family enzyme